jgi:predicted nucleic acid-binding protein
VIFDTDVLIWVTRGDPKAADWVDHASSRHLSVQSYLELLQGAKDMAQLKNLKKYIFEGDFYVLPITENISHRAMVYIEEYGLTHGLQAGDALIAATAVEHNQPLASGNAKHFRAIRDLELKVFKP